MSQDTVRVMRRHIASYVQTTAGGERTRHFTAKQPPGMLKLDSGDPVFPTPPHIREAALKALEAGLTRYAPGQGDSEFLEAMCQTMGFAREVADRVVFMDEGVIVETGDPKTFFSTRREERTKRVLEKIL